MPGAPSPGESGPSRQGFEPREESLWRRRQPGTVSSSTPGLQAPTLGPGGWLRSLVMEAFTPTVRATAPRALIISARDTPSPSASPCTCSGSGAAPPRPASVFQVPS